MALPDDAITKYYVQEANAVLDKAERLVRLHRPDIYQTYFTPQYGFSPPESALTTNQRKLRVLGCLMGVDYDTDDATTEAAIVTAVQALVT